jgi:hypothetical protein
VTDVDADAASGASLLAIVLLNRVALGGARVPRGESGARY